VGFFACIPLALRAKNIDGLHLFTDTNKIGKVENKMLSAETAEEYTQKKGKR
jgi:hypothetical protein